MKKLTKEQKIKVLKLALEKFETSPSKTKFICSTVLYVLFDLKYAISESEYEYNISLKLIPELLKYKPKNKHERSSWFTMTEDSKKKRINIIKKTIKDIEKLL